MNLLESLPEPLTIAQEDELARQIRRKPNDADSVNTLALHNMREGFLYLKRCCRARIPDDELFSLCYLKLRQNAKRFQPGRVRFLAFAKPGLRGALSDYWKTIDTVRNSSLHEDANTLDTPSVVSTLSQNCRKGLEDLGEENLADDWISRLVTGVAQKSDYKNQEPSEEADFNSIDVREKMTIVSEIIEAKLTEQEQMILSLVYTSGFNFPEIGKLLSVTRSAVQLSHAKALKKIRGELSRQKKLLI